MQTQIDDVGNPSSIVILETVDVLAVSGPVLNIQPVACSATRPMELER